MQRPVPASPSPHGIGYSLGSNFSLPVSAVSQGSFILLWKKVGELLGSSWLEGGTFPWPD